MTIRSKYFGGFWRVQTFELWVPLGPFGFFDIWCSCQDDKPFSIGETWEQIVRATQKARSNVLILQWCILIYFDVYILILSTWVRLLALSCASPPITGLRGRRPCRLRKRWTWDACSSNSESDTHTHRHTPMLGWKPSSPESSGMPSISFQRPWSGSESTKPWKALPTVPGTVSRECISSYQLLIPLMPTLKSPLLCLRFDDFELVFLGICESLPQGLPCCPCGGVGQAIWARLPRCLGCGLHCLVAAGSPAFPKQCSMHCLDTVREECCKRPRRIKLPTGQSREQGIMIEVDKSLHKTCDVEGCTSSSYVWIVFPVQHRSRLF